MADIFSPEKRSEVMSRIRGHDTKPELALRSMLHRLGYRFTVNGPKNQSFPGKPAHRPPPANTSDIFGNIAPSYRPENATTCSGTSMPGSKAVTSERAA
jgi:hypothetical protein